MGDYQTFAEPTYPRELIGAGTIYGRVRDHKALREAIDINPHLYSARLSDDYWAIMVELNQYLPDGMLVTVEDVRLAMLLRPVEQPPFVLKAKGTATARGGTGGP